MAGRKGLIFEYARYFMEHPEADPDEVMAAYWREAYADSPEMAEDAIARDAAKRAERERRLSEEEAVHLAAMFRARFYEEAERNINASSKYYLVPTHAEVFYKKRLAMLSRRSGLASDEINRRAVRLLNELYPPTMLHVKE